MTRVKRTKKKGIAARFGERGGVHLDSTETPGGVFTVDYFVQNKGKGGGIGGESEGRRAADVTGTQEGNESITRRLGVFRGKPPCNKAIGKKR